jgi:hypothetical protein
MTYGVEITETLQLVVYIETDGEESAIDAVREMVDAEHIALDSDDFAGRDYSIYSVEPKAKEGQNG